MVGIREAYQITTQFENANFESLCPARDETMV